ncbi:uncharacterized protein TrAFT101_008229 [Trichoderma asperellum]|uniref:uncharacterized protein n=1 Tax=Trichoderma asperellum TaxID=101201 RepID=UPI0033348B37|nr:hypothetical protein TrAFT101_008229 [Trichoderma asperellum]
MPNIRQIKTCSRCRLLKLRCDRIKPSCERCVQAEASCSFLHSHSPQSVVQAEHLNSTRSSSEQSSSPSDESVPSSDIAAQKIRKTVKRRNRAHLSCTRCHRLKVRCDKELPCSRCRGSGWGKLCTYTHRVEKDSSPSDSSRDTLCAAAHEDPKHIYTSWHTRRRGATHWKTLVSRIEASARNLGHVFVHGVHMTVLHADCHTDIALPCNFPFNSPGAAKFSSLDKVYSLLHGHREHCESFVDGYFALYQPVHPIIDPVGFADEVNCFWDDPTQADISWLSSFLMVLALGCFTVTRDTKLMVEFCLAAEACLSKTAFLVRPSMSVMRTLCLIVLVKQLSNGTCWSFDASWTLLGIIVRLAVCIGLHKPPTSTPVEENAVTYSEWQSGHILWITIVYFCIQTAAVTGMPTLLSSDDILERTDVQDVLLPHAEGVGPWFSLCDAFPIICKIIARVNSGTKATSYDEILEYNATIRRLMAASMDHPECNDSLRAILDIFFRRVLMVLHRCHALLPNAPELYPVSYWASLECSLAILVHHRNLCEHRGNSIYQDLLGRLYKLDFFAAALTASLYLLQRDAPLAVGFAIPPRQTILETLETCTEIWGRDKDRSICFRSGYRTLTFILTMLSGMDSMTDYGLPHSSVACT